MEARSRASQKTEWRTEKMMKTTMTTGTSTPMRRTKKTTTMFRRLCRLLVDLRFIRLEMMKMRTTMRKTVAMRTAKETVTTTTMMMTTTMKTKKRRRIWELSTFADQSVVLRMKRRPVILNRKRTARMMMMRLMKMRTMMGKWRHRQRGRGSVKMILTTTTTVVRMMRGHPRGRSPNEGWVAIGTRSIPLVIVIDRDSDFQISSLCNVFMGYDHSAIIT